MVPEVRYLVHFASILFIFDPWWSFMVIFTFSVFSRWFSIVERGYRSRSKTTFSTLHSISKVLSFWKLTGNERFRKSKISAFIIIKNYWNRFIIKKVMLDYVSDFDDEKWLAFLFFVLPVPVEQRRETLHKSSSFLIIKVRYIFLCNFFVNEPISIIFDDYESWDLALSETLISGEFPAG